MNILKQTNLEEVKDVAKMFLYMDIGETAYSPIIIKHPFSDSGITMVKNKTGDFETVDLTKEEDLDKWRKHTEQMIMGSGSAFELHMMVTKPYALVFLQYISDYLSDQDYADILSSSWLRSENPNLDPNFNKRTLLSLFKRAVPSMLMDENEYAKYEKLDDTITIYRGVTSYNEKNKKALSWTLDVKVAEWFAKRYGQEGTVYKAQINKEYIYALFDGRAEAEVIVDPKHLKNITERQTMDESMDENTCSFVLQ